MVTKMPELLWKCLGCKFEGVTDDFIPHPPSKELACPKCNSMRIEAKND